MQSSSLSLGRNMLTKLCSAALLSIAVITLMSAAEPPPIPRSFSAYIGGFLGASYRVELHDGALVYTTFDPGHRNLKHVTITPTTAQWREFRQTLDNLKVWQWRSEYLTNGAKDGTQWSLDIAYADHSINIYGNNNYPDSVGKPNSKPKSTKAFNRYLNAVKRLTGGKTFE